MKTKFLLSLILTTCLSNPNLKAQTTYPRVYDSVYNAINHLIGNGEALPVLQVTSVAIPLMDILVSVESTNEFSEDLLPLTRSLICYSDPSNSISINNYKRMYMLVLIDKSIENHYNEAIYSLFMKQKLRNEITRQLKTLSHHDYPSYSYQNSNRDYVTFVSIKSGNDLFTLAGIAGAISKKEFSSNNTFFQRNDDRDYTGSFLLELGTNKFPFKTRRPIKSYQTISYGFDVFTPYFDDDSLFATDSSFNLLDRPHASFQYFGWKTNIITRSDKARFAIGLRIGKIGGKVGENFQTVLHQDVSYSDRPKGWRAQISDGGRLGISADFNADVFQIPLYYHNFNPQSIKNTYVYFNGGFNLGTYLTKPQIGINLSNKSFRQVNPNQIQLRTKQNPIYNWTDFFTYNISYQYGYVVHNTMLEGYGVFKTTEVGVNEKLPAGEPSFMKSDHKLVSSQVNRHTQVFSVNLSYRARHSTLFYNWKSFSPETKLNDIGIQDPSVSERKNMDISGRWHHFAEIGCVFIF